MPVENSSKTSKTRKKDEVSQKVQEIKQRQQNWLKQRELSKQQKEPEFKIKQSLSTQSRPNAATTILRRTNSLNNTAKQITEAPSVRGRFKNWIDAKNSAMTHEDITEFNDCNSFCSESESELEGLVSPDPSSSIQPVSEEHFEELAEKIASKVKEDLGFSHSGSFVSQRSASTESNLVENAVWNSNHNRAFTHDVQPLKHLGISNLTSHNCSICKNVMISSKTIPMMVIPCGHTLCKACSEGRSTCPTCDCPVVSFTVNIMLQQIIQEYHANSSSHSNKPLQNGKNDIKGFSVTSQHLSTTYIEDKLETHMASYKEQLANLETRYEILLSEQKTLCNKQKLVTSHLHLEQMQTQKISKQGEEIQKAISDLQERLKVLQEHRRHYESHISELKAEESELEGKMNLLSTTITSLVREIEKIKLLSEGEDSAEIG